MLGFVGDVGAGALYIITLAHGLGPGGDRFRNGRLWTKFMIVAGLLKFIAIADAYHIAIGKKQRAAFRLSHQIQADDSLGTEYAQSFRCGGGVPALRLHRLRHHAS